MRKVLYLATQLALAQMRGANFSTDVGPERITEIEQRIRMQRLTDLVTFR